MFFLLHTFDKDFENTVCTAILIEMEKCLEKFFSVFNLLRRLKSIKTIIYVASL